MSENSSRLENESNPSDEYLLKEITKIKAELKELKNLKEKTYRSSKPAAKRNPVKRKAVVKRKTAAKRKPVKRKAVVKRKTAAKRKPVKRKAVVKRKTIRRK
jgi:hypothetical protein